MQPLQQSPPIPIHQIPTSYSSRLVHIPKHPPTPHSILTLTAINSPPTHNYTRLSFLMRMLYKLYNFTIDIHNILWMLISGIGWCSEVMGYWVDVGYGFWDVFLLLLGWWTVGIVGTVGIVWLDCYEMCDIVSRHGLCIPDTVLTTYIQPITYFYHESLFSTNLPHNLFLLT